MHTGISVHTLVHKGVQKITLYIALIQKHLCLFVLRRGLPPTKFHTKLQLTATFPWFFQHQTHVLP